jgi:tetratricopeptide (TPR) repeat protein
MLGSLFSGLKKKKKTEISLSHFLVDSIDLFENGRYKEAANHFGLIIRAYPEHPLAHLMLARTYIELKAYKQAINSLFMHLQIVPNSVEAMIYLGLSYYECGEMPLAEERFEEAMKLRGNSLLVRENLAIARIQSGNLEEALDDLVGLHKDEPNDQGIIELIVLTLGRLGKWEAAKQYVHQMDELQPAAEELDSSTGA